MQKIKERLKNKKGFTLVEMIVVLAIIGILIALIAPNMARIIQDGQETSDTAKAKTTLTSAQAYGTRQVSNGQSIVTTGATTITGGTPVATTGYAFELTNDSIKAFYGGSTENFMTSSGDAYLNSNVVKGDDKIYVYTSEAGAMMGAVYTNNDIVKAVAGFAPVGVIQGTGTADFTTGDLKGGTYDDGKITPKAGGTTPPTTPAT